MSERESILKMDRRGFLRSATAVSAGLALAPTILSAASQADESEDLNVALIGAGAQGKELMEGAVRLPGVRFKAVCDIWPYNRQWVSGRLRAYRHPNHKYEDYREMLAQEKNLDAVIVASPDCFHAEHTVACLEAGLHV